MLMPNIFGVHGQLLLYRIIVPGAWLGDISPVLRWVLSDLLPGLGPLNANTNVT